jgi:hypothetical protein
LERNLEGNDDDVVAKMEALLSQRRERMSADIETVREEINKAVAKCDAELRRRERISGDMKTDQQQMNQAVAKRDAEPPLRECMTEDMEISAADQPGSGQT